MQNFDARVPRNRCTSHIDVFTKQDISFGFITQAGLVDSLDMGLNLTSNCPRLPLGRASSTPQPSNHKVGLSG